MLVPVVNMQGEEVSEVELRPEIFEAPVNVTLMHQALVRQLANGRAGTHKTRTRSENNRSKSKWYRQKGTGRARHGSRNAPIFVGGGIAHGPTPHKYEKKMPRKMRRAALRSALSVKASENAVVVVDEFVLADSKTRVMAGALDALVGQESALVVIPEKAAFENVIRAAGNLPGTKVLLANYMNIRDLLKFDKVVFLKASLEVLEGYLG